MRRGSKRSGYDHSPCKSTWLLMSSNHRAVNLCDIKQRTVSSSWFIHPNPYPGTSLHSLGLKSVSFISTKMFLMAFAAGVPDLKLADHVFLGNGSVASRSGEVSFPLCFAPMRPHPENCIQRWGP